MADKEADFNIDYVAELARIELTPEEKQRIGSQLEQVLDYVNQLSSLDVTGIRPMSHAAPLTNVTRPDTVRPSLTHEKALQNAPAQINGLIRTPKIVE